MVFAIVYVCAIPARGKKCLVVSCFYNSSMHQTMNILIYGLEGFKQIEFYRYLGFVVRQKYLSYARHGNLQFVFFSPHF